MMLARWNLDAGTVWRRIDAPLQSRAHPGGRRAGRIPTRAGSHPHHERQEHEREPPRAPQLRVSRGGEDHLRHSLPHRVPSVNAVLRSPSLRNFVLPGPEAGGVLPAQPDRTILSADTRPGPASYPSCRRSPFRCRPEAGWSCLPQPRSCAHLPPARAWRWPP
jgi:hypothetical protein